MNIKTLLAASVLALSLPMAAQAQGLVRGAERGAQDGADAAGPVGAIVGGAVGAATGTVGGILGVDDRPRFRQYVTRERVVLRLQRRRPRRHRSAERRRDLLRRARGVQRPRCAIHHRQRAPGARRPQPPHRRSDRLSSTAPNGTAAIPEASGDPSPGAFFCPTVRSDRSGTLSRMNVATLDRFGVTSGSIDVEYRFVDAGQG